MRNEKWGYWFIGILVVATFALAGVIELVLPRASEQWTGAAMAAWILVVALITAALRAPHVKNGFWLVALGIAANLAWLTMGFCAKGWNLILFPPNGHMFTILFPVTAPPAFLYIWRHARDPESVAHQQWPFNPESALKTQYFIAVGHLILCFNQTTLATKLFLAFFAIVSIAAWRMTLHKKTKDDVDAG